MSCFVVPDDHLCFLVQAARVFRVKVEDPDAVVKMLWDANLEAYSVRYRMGTEKGMEDINRFGPRKYEAVARSIEPLEVIKAVLCIQYQISDHPDHKALPAWDWLEGLLHVAVRKLPGYSDANGWVWRYPPTQKPLFVQEVAQ